MKNELVLNSNNIGVSTTKESLLKKKKKGFTLVELIAVIAILAILAAIIVPRVANYTTNATSAKQKTNARTLASAIETYNTEHTGTPIGDTDSLLPATDGTASAIKTKLMPDYIQTWPSDADIRVIAPGSGTGTSAITEGSYAALKKYISGQ